MFHSPITTVPGAAAWRVLAARGRHGATAAALLGVATGIAHPGTATLTRACTNLLAHSPAALVTSWQLYALLAAGAMIISVGEPWGKVSRGTKPGAHPRREMSPYRVPAAAN